MEGKYGRKMEYDPSWKGPLHKRSCTDCFWLIIFIIFLAGWSAVAYYAFLNGNIEKLVHPSDSEGRRCGIDSQVKDKPYLIFFDLTKCARISPKYRTCNTTQVCVKECPKKNFYYNDAKSSGLQQLKEQMICKTDVKLEKIRFDQLDTLVDHEKCARWYLESTPLIGRCIPNAVWGEFVNDTITNEDLQDAKKVVQAIANVEDVLKKVYQDIKATKYVVLGIAVISGFVSLFYIVVLRWLAAPCIWTTILAICALLSYGTYETTIIYASNRYTEWLILLILCAALLSLIILATLFLRKRIYLACQLIKESSKAVTCILSSLFFPIVPWVLHILVVTYGVTIYLYLLTIWTPNYRVEMMGDGCQCSPSLNYNQNSSCDPDIFNANCKVAGESCTLSACNLVSKDRPWFIKYFHAVNIIGFYWLFFFVSAFGEMVLAATFATWYWTYHKQDVPYFTITVGFWRTIRYHLGTLAFGALILTICRIIRLILEAISNKVKKANNQFANGIICCCRCFFYLLENFLRFINNNAYIMCAVHGKGFCRSARDAFNLLMRNVVRVVVINKITSWLLLLGKLLITGLTVAATWWYYTTQAQVNFWAVPATMTAVASFLIATVFFKVHAAAIDTLFLCFLEDCERNDGSTERPYYMSKRLRKLLHK